MLQDGLLEFKENSLGERLMFLSKQILMQFHGNRQ
jgi:hypothetical protein